MNTRRSVAFVLSAVLILIAVRAGFAKTSADPAADNPYPYAGDDARILTEIQNNSEAMANLEYLSDSIGARLTGTDGLKRANDWTKQKFTEYGLTNVHLEPWKVERTWARGSAHARILAPAEHPLTIVSAAWSPGTSGRCARAGGLFRREGEKRFREISRQIERRNSHLHGADEFVAATAGRSVSRVHAADAEAAGENRRGDGKRSV